MIEIMSDTEALLQVIDMQQRSAEHYAYAMKYRLLGMTFDAVHGAEFAAHYSHWLRNQIHNVVPRPVPLKFRTVFYYHVVDGTLCLIEGERVERTYPHE